MLQEQFVIWCKMKAVLSTMKLYQGSNCIALVLGWRWVVDFLPWWFSPQGNWHVFNRRLGWPYSHL